MANENSPQIRFQVKFDGEPEQDIALRAWLFSSNGKLLSSAPVVKEEVVFDQKEPISGTPRILIAPQVEGRITEVKNINDLARLKAYEPVINFDEKRGIRILPIPEYYWRWWCWKFCRVRGRVVKDFDFNGVLQEKAICHARINIYEVDKICFWIHKVPNHIIDRIKQSFIDGPVHPKPGDPVENMAAVASVKNIFSPLRQEATLPVIHTEIRSKLLVNDNDLVRKAIVDHFDVLRPYFCWWPWFYPYFFKSDLITTVYSDTNGFFDTSFLHFYCCHSRRERFINTCCDSEPDLYFTIDYQINGVWTSVYKPCLPTSTIWNYACGSDITLRITDPRVPWGCHNQVPGSTVWIKSIGGGASVTHIEQSASSTTAPAYNDTNFKPLPSAPFRKIGLSDASFPYSPNTYRDNRRPFAGQLRLIVQFGSAFPANGIKYYRWSYLKTALADLSPTGNTLYKDIVVTEIRKSYQFEFLDAGGVRRPGGTASVKLGPFTVGAQNNLFFIPPNLLPGASAPFLTNPAIELDPWWDYNTDTISFDTNTLEGDGLYDFKLELFDAAGNTVEAPKTEYNIPVVSFPAPEWDPVLSIWRLSQQAPDAYLTPGSTPANAAAYHMNVRIDNNPAEGDIYMVQILSGGDYIPTAANCCGFVQYDPAQFNNDNLLKITFKAKHIHNFADLSFGIQRGTCSDATQSAATNTNAMVMGDTNNGYTRDASTWVYEKTFSPATLLGTCSEEQKAAFAESLTVQPLAINGDGQVFGTVSAIAAFAIEPLAP